MPASTPAVLIPDWVKDAVFYQIFSDRFAKSDRVSRSSLRRRITGTTPNRGGRRLQPRQPRDPLRRRRLAAGCPRGDRDDDFWREFRRRVEGVDPGADLVGEIWHESKRWLQGDQFDAVMNYPVTEACLGSFGGERLDMEETG
jgi:glycosidase